MRITKYFYLFFLYELEFVCNLQVITCARIRIC